MGNRITESISKLQNPLFFNKTSSTDTEYGAFLGWLPEGTRLIHQMSPRVGFLSALVFSTPQHFGFLDQGCQCRSVDLFWGLTDAVAGLQKFEAQAHWALPVGAGATGLD